MVADSECKGHGPITAATSAVFARQIAVRRDHTFESVVAVAQRRLATCDRRTLRSVTCDEVDGTLVLRGKVHSYFYKQLAQKLVRDLAEQMLIVNSVFVDD